MTTHYRRLIAFVTAGLIAASSLLITAPSASAAKADLEWFFDRALREVIDVGT